MEKNTIDFKKLILEMAREAGKIQLEYFRTKKIRVKIKEVYEGGAEDFVTNVDELAEKKIIDIIKKSKMKCKIISEEIGELNVGKSDYTWIVDPIDGTYEYSVGNSNFCVAVSLMKAGKPMMGLLYWPVLNDIYFAEKGKGAFLNGKRIHVSEEAEMKKSRIAFMVDPASYKKEISKRIYSSLVDSSFLVFADTGNFVFRDIATGYLQGAIFIIPPLVYDFMPGAIIAEEAGVVVTDFAGNEITDRTEAFVAGNKEIHKKLLSIVKE